MNVAKQGSEGTALAVVGTADRLGTRARRLPHARSARLPRGRPGRRAKRAPLGKYADFADVWVRLSCSQRVAKVQRVSCEICEFLSGGTLTCCKDEAVRCGGDGRKRLAVVAGGRQGSACSNKSRPRVPGQRRSLPSPGVGAEFARRVHLAAFGWVRGNRLGFSHEFEN